MRTKTRKVELRPRRAARTSAVPAAGRYCSLRAGTERLFAPDVHAERARLILISGQKWVNGTTLHYYFFDRATDGENLVLSDGSTEWRTWVGDPAERAVVRKAFQAWKALGIGLEFKEVSTREEAEIRIGFMRGDGAWSYIGREILDFGKNERTMNFGWLLAGASEDLDTPIHEIGHTLGFPHEHQNPNAGIVWNEEAVYAALAAPPNNWNRQKTYHNVIRKIAPDTVQGSSWDPNSVMHYPFDAGLIQEPPQYRNGLTPAGGISERDKTWIKTFYPALTHSSYAELKPFQSVELQIAAREQRDFLFVPEATRTYDLQTFGESDTVMVLFEDDGTEFRYVTADDDSGTAYNSKIRVKLFKGRRYAVRIRLYYTEASGRTAVMAW